VIRGTRITVETILGYLSAGDSSDDVLQSHPRLEMADVLACIDYARERNWNIITRDTDFFDQLMLDGPPPKVI